MIINLIASPRNISTALMYSLGKHSYIYPIDEPFYACYLTETGKNHPDRKLILEHQPNDRKTVFKQIQEADQNHPVVFVKNMAHHIREKDFQSMEAWRHCFLIRHPKLHIHSFAKVIPHPRLEDLGTTTQRELYDILLKKGHQPHIIDSNKLLEDQENELRRFCTAMDIEFDNSMLSWPSGPKSFDGCWAPHWYRSAWASTGFGPPKDPNGVQLPAYLHPLLEECLTDYQYLYDQIKR